MSKWVLAVMANTLGSNQGISMGSPISLLTMAGATQLLDFIPDAIFVFIGNI